MRPASRGTSSTVSRSSVSRILTTTEHGSGRSRAGRADSPALEQRDGPYGDAFAAADRAEAFAPLRLHRHVDAVTRRALRAVDHAFDAGGDRADVLPQSRPLGRDHNVDVHDAPARSAHAVDDVAQH